MDQISQFSRCSLFSEVDSFHWEVEYFERDVHILILGTLAAAKTYLSVELEKDLFAIDKVKGSGRKSV